MKKYVKQYAVIVFWLCFGFLNEGIWADAEESRFTTYSQVYDYVLEQTAQKSPYVEFIITDFNPESFYPGNAFYEVDQTFAEERGYRTSASVNKQSGTTDVTFQYQLIYPAFSKGDSLSDNGLILTSHKMWYQECYKALKTNTMEVPFQAIYSYPYNNEGVMVLNQHSELNYGTWCVDKTQFEDSKIEFKDDSYSVAQRKKYMEKADQKAAAISKSIIKKGMSQKQKIKAIHDYIVKNCVYDTKAASKNTFTLSHTAYSALVSKKAVCQGYAGAFNLLMEKAGLKSICVAGEAQGGAHMWNMMKLGSDIVYVDATFDDPIPDQGKKVSYSYYALEKSELEKDHTWDNSQFGAKYLNY